MNPALNLTFENYFFLFVTLNHLFEDNYDCSNDVPFFSEVGYASADIKRTLRERTGVRELRIFCFPRNIQKG